VRATVAHRPRKGVSQQRELHVAPDQRAGEHADRSPFACRLGHHAPGRDGLGEPAQAPGARGLELERVSGEPVGGRADENLVRLGALLQARGEVHRPPGCERQLRVLGEHFTGLDADAAFDPEPGDGRSDLEGRAERSFGIVLMRERDGERRHHGVTGKRLDGAPVRFDAAGDELEELRHAPADDLGIRCGDKRRRADEVDEHDRCELPFD
jgi:hypothetical protein